MVALATEGLRCLDELRVTSAAKADSNRLPLTAGLKPPTTRAYSAFFRSLRKAYSTRRQCIEGKTALARPSPALGEASRCRFLHIKQKGRTCAVRPFAILHGG